MRINPLTAIDFYKADHRRQYPEGTNLVYSNFTARSGKYSNLPKDWNGKVVMFGLTYFIKEFLDETFNDMFFNMPEEAVVEAYKKRLDTALGGDWDVSHIRALHQLGYLPLEIRALPELTEVPIKVPMLTVHNTHPDFFWLVNYIESVMSCYLWKSCTSATTAKYYHDLLSKYAEETTGDTSFVPFQAHDFSFRGMASPQDAAISGAAHLQYFKGTDSVLAIDLLEQYYGKDCTKELIGCSVPATEHSVMCMGTEEGEVETFKRLITELYPSGIVSIVSDTWDFWQVISEYTKRLKDDILARDGKVVFRPDSGDPVKIICGDPTAPEGTLEHKGAVEVLWEEFGGEITKQGYKVLDSHVGLIYGDSITPEVAKSMLEALRAKGYASTNIVLGVGSFTYQYVTRDTYGFAVKATYGEVDGVGREIYKDPKTDSGMKKSAKGLLHVRNEGGELVLVDRHTSLEDSGELKTVYKDGVIYV